ncbi:MAG TPA: PAAR domain-containing protein [Actinomycetes bacterium]
MGRPAAKQGDRVTATDMHLIVPPSAGPPVSTPHNFSGRLDGGLSRNVRIMGRPAATKGSTATNLPPHLPVGGSFAKPPSNRGTVAAGSPTVFINGRAAARDGDPVTTCNDPVDAPVGSIAAAGTVRIGARR